MQSSSSRLLSLDLVVAVVAVREELQHKERPPQQQLRVRISHLPEDPQAAAVVEDPEMLRLVPMAVLDSAQLNRSLNLVLLPLGLLQRSCNDQPRQVLLLAQAVERLPLLMACPQVEGSVVDSQELLELLALHQNLLIRRISSKPLGRWESTRMLVVQLLHRRLHRSQLQLLQQLLLQQPPPHQPQRLTLHKH